MCFRVLNFRPSRHCMDEPLLRKERIGFAQHVSHLAMKSVGKLLHNVQEGILQITDDCHPIACA